jgi:hypothetical protein
MPVLEREVLVLFYLDELILAELADVLGIPIGTAKSRLFRARRILRARSNRSTRRARESAGEEHTDDSFRRRHAETARPRAVPAGAARPHGAARRRRRRSRH